MALWSPWREEATGEETCSLAWVLVVAKEREMRL